MVKVVQQPPPIDRSAGQHLLALDRLLGGVASGTSILPAPAKGGNLGGSSKGVGVTSTSSALPSQPPIVGEEMVRKLQEISANQQSALSAGNELDPER